MKNGKVLIDQGKKYYSKYSGKESCKERYLIWLWYKFLLLIFSSFKNIEVIEWEW